MVPVFLVLDLLRPLIKLLTIRMFLQYVFCLVLQLFLPMSMSGSDNGLFLMSMSGSDNGFFLMSMSGSDNGLFIMSE